MSDDDTVLLNLPGNEEPIDQLWVFLSVDEHGHEGICSMPLNGANWAMVTSKPEVLAKMRPAAKEISKRVGKPVRLVRFTQREIVETITAGMN